jgi:hypothetical protein
LSARSDVVLFVESGMVLFIEKPEEKRAADDGCHDADGNFVLR